MNIPSTFRPLIKPINFLLHDHRFVVGVLAAIAFVVSTNVPQLANQEQLVLTGLVAVVTLLIGGYSFDNLTATVKGAPTSLKDAEQQALNTGLTDVLTLVSGPAPLIVPSTITTTTTTTAPVAPTAPATSSFTTSSTATTDTEAKG